MTGKLSSIFQYLSKNSFSILSILLIIFGVSIPYITGAIPHCCDDIEYVNLYNQPLSERLSLSGFWYRTNTEGRFVFGLVTDTIMPYIATIFPGHMATHVYGFMSILFTAIVAMLIASLWQSERKEWVLISLLLFFNPFLLMLYPWVISFSAFSFANLILVFCFYCYCKNNRFIFILPIVIFLSIGTYQPTLSFLLEVAFLHFFVRCFYERKLDIRKEIRFYGAFLLASFAGYVLYSLTLKVLLAIAGIPTIKRFEMWHNKTFSNFIDVLSFASDSFKSFANNGISSGIDPSQSVLVGHLSLQSPLIIIYQFLLGLMVILLFVQSIQKRSRLQAILVILVVPVSILITILPLIVSGSGMIGRVFYPFGLVLPALVSVQLNGCTNRFRLDLIMRGLGFMFVGLLGAFYIQTFNGMVDATTFAKAEYQDVLTRLSTSREYNSNSPVLIYPYIPHQDRRPELGGNAWPLFHVTTPYIGKFIKYSLGKDINLIELNALNNEELIKVENFISDHDMLAWPGRSAIKYMSNLRGGIFLIYYPYDLAVQRMPLPPRSRKM
jgi:hypothetical protein